MNRDELAFTLATNFTKNPNILKLLDEFSKNLSFKKAHVERLSVMYRRADIPFNSNQIESEEETIQKLSNIIMEKSYELADRILLTLTN